MPIPVWCRVVPMALRIQPLVVRTVGIQRVGIDTTLAGRNRLATDRFNHRVALGVHDDPADLISSLIRGGAREPAYPLCGKAVSEYVEVINFHTQKIAWAINQRAFQRKVASAFLSCPQVDSN